MKQYNMLQAFYMSFYSKQLYRDVDKNWGFSVVGYLFLLLFVLWAITMVPIQKKIDQMARDFTARIAPQLPQTFAVKDGELTTTENKPYLVKDPDNNKLLLIIDTSGQYTKLDNDSDVLLVTKKEVITRKDGGRIEITPLSTFKKDYTFTTAEVSAFFDKTIHWAWIFVLPFMLFFSLIYRLIESVIYALFGKVFAWVSSIRISYGHVLKLAIVSLTPTIVLGMGMDFFSVRFPYEWVLFFLIAMAYLIFAVTAQKES